MCKNNNKEWCSWIIFIVFCHLWRLVPSVRPLLSFGGSSLMCWVPACGDLRLNPGAAETKWATLMDLNLLVGLAVSTRCLLQTSSTPTKHKQNTTFFLSYLNHTCNDSCVKTLPFIYRATNYSLENGAYSGD